MAMGILKVREFYSRLTYGGVKLPPRPPVSEKADFFWTAAYSRDHEPAAPRRLLDLALDSARAVRDIENDLHDIWARPDAPEWARCWPGEHYLFLAGLMKVLRPRIVVEIGTDTGLSALVMHKFRPPGGKLVTFDLVPWAQVEDHILRQEDLADGTLEQRLADLSDPAIMEKHRDLLESAEFFFVDGPKDNVFEYRLMETFKRLKFEKSPVLMFDDTKLMSMIRFWDELKHPKLDVTSLAHWSGSGLVEWSSGES
jgi:predicted O-methyltransferase YrrM